MFGSEIYKFNNFKIYIIKKIKYLQYHKGFAELEICI